MSVLDNLIIEHPFLMTLMFGLLVNKGEPIKVTDKVEFFGQLLGKILITGVVFYTLTLAHR